VTRRSRLDEFVTNHHPTADRPVQLLCEDHVGTYVIPFPCQYTAGEWVNTATGERIQGNVVGWRDLGEASGGSYTVPRQDSHLSGTKIADVSPGNSS
jgi:hypothetical protein